MKYELNSLVSELKLNLFFDYFTQLDNETVKVTGDENFETELETLRNSVEFGDVASKLYAEIKNEHAEMIEDEDEEDKTSVETLLHFHPDTYRKYGKSAIFEMIVEYV